MLKEKQNLFLFHNCLIFEILISCWFSLLFLSEKKKLFRRVRFLDTLIRSCVRWSVFKPVMLCNAFAFCSSRSDVWLCREKIEDYLRFLTRAGKVVPFCELYGADFDMNNSNSLVNFGFNETMQKVLASIV